MTSATDQAATRNKIATVTVAFWIMKIAATTLGETGGDHVSKTLHLGYGSSSAIFLSVLLAALVVQFIAKRYNPVLFWTVILSTSTAGTTMSDFMDRTLGWGYEKGSAVLVSCLVTTLLVWRLTEKSMSVTDVRSRRTEIYYWTAVLFSNTLGTAMGDYIAERFGEGGFYKSAILFGSLLAVNLALYLFTRVNRVVLFWIAFVLTRPFGATFGDVLVRPRDEGGLDIGTGGASLVLAAILVVFVVRAQLQERQTARRAAT